MSVRAGGRAETGCLRTSPKPKVQLEQSYLKAGQDEVHSFFWGEDLEEAVTGQQNKPTGNIMGFNGQLYTRGKINTCPVTQRLRILKTNLTSMRPRLKLLKNNGRWVLCMKTGPPFCSPI